MRLKHLSMRTEEAFFHWVTEFIIFHNKRDPAESGESEIHVYLSHIIQRKFVFSSS
ncbi:MAG: phage integrase N-terminal SAM-like domain-containing protein [Bacteroidota bacterium]